MKTFVIRAVFYGFLALVALFFVALLWEQTTLVGIGVVVLLAGAVAYKLGLWEGF